MSGFVAFVLLLVGWLLTQAYADPVTDGQAWLLLLGQLGVGGGAGWLIGGAILAYEEMRHFMKSTRDEVREIRRAQVNRLLRDVERHLE